MKSLNITKILLIFSIIFMGGCATAPVRKGVSLKGPTYRIGKTAYVSLASVVDQYKLSYDWDSISKKLTLWQGDKKAVLGIGSRVALIEGVPKNLDKPVMMYRSMIVLPKSFVLSGLVKVFTRGYRPPRSAAKTAASAKPGVYAMRKVVIDAGHGGKDPGATGQYGLREKELVLDVAKRLKPYLERAGIEVILTRANDKFISLWKRADIANKEKADFFVSIHANAFRSRSARGFEVYYLSEAIDDNARAIAAAENASLKYESSSFGNKRPSSTLEATLWDLEYAENRRESKELAEYISSTAKNRLKTASRGVKAARFYVLKGARMPSVLIEIGFLSNRGEARKLKSGEYRETLARTIAEGILDYKREFDKSEGFTK